MFVIDLKTNDFNSVCAKPRAIDINETTHQIIIGTYGCEIFKVNYKNNTVKDVELVTSGHYQARPNDTNEVWGLAVNPANPDQYVTVSDDATLRVWSYSKRAMQQWINMDSAKVLHKKDSKADDAQPRSCDFSSDGALLAVGFKSGVFRVFKTLDWSCIKQVQDPVLDGSLIEDLKFSPDQNHLAVSCHNGAVCVFELPSFTRYCKLEGSKSAINHLDWSADSEYLRINNSSYEILFYKLKSGTVKPMPASDLRNTEWASNTCTLSWATQGIWTGGMDGSDINHCNVSAKSHADGYKLLATADDFGFVKLFRFPSMMEAANSLTLKGHCSHVTKVNFTSDNHLISTGGNDCTVIQWHIQM
jgi:WD40 repeat protein